MASKAMSKIPASIRSNNPGAMWGGPSARKFGATRAEALRDGLGQGNEIAHFPTKVQGAAALFDLLARNYAGLVLREAIKKWSGGNSLLSYLTVIETDTGLRATDRLTLDYLRDPKTGVAFGKAMTRHEAGRPYPMTDAEWQEAHRMAFAIPAADAANDRAEPATPWVDKLLEWERLGVKEVPGPGSNPTIDEMFLACGHPKGKFRDDTAWCAISGYAALVHAGVDIPPPSQNTMARSFLSAFPRVPLDQVRRGDFRVRRRGPAPYGHVDCVLAVRGKYVDLIGGNVSDKFTRDTELLAADDVLGYVRPHLPETKPEIVLPAPREMERVSGKVGVLSKASRVMHSIWLSIAGLFTLENLGFAQGVVTDVKQLAQDLALPALGVAAICGVFLARHIIARVAMDYAEGRYIPSGHQGPGKP